MRFDSQCPSTLFVALADPPEGREDEFHEWYDTVHGPDALENGSFTAVHRFRAVGPGHRAAPFLALWEGRFASEAEAWGYIGPRAQALREAGRVGDIASVRFAIMLFAVGGLDVREPGQPCEPVAALTTVQNDWRHPESVVDPVNWCQRFAPASGPDPGPGPGSGPGPGPDPGSGPGPGAGVRPTAGGLDGAPRWLATSDPAGRGAGHHLAVFPSTARGDSVAESWRGLGTPGMSPLPAYQTIFGASAGPDDDRAGDPSPSPAWVMHWEPVSSLRA